MIKLTIQNGLNQEIRLFDKSMVIIGSRLPEADICLSDASVQPIHLKIIQQDSVFILINVANDPFAAVNGNSFGKKTLSSGDQIEIGNLNIKFDITDNLADTLESLDSENLLNRLENKISSPLPSTIQIPIENQEEIDLQLLDELENWEMEYLSQEAEEESEKEVHLSKETSHNTVLSIKDAHLSDTGEENETWYPESNVLQKEAPTLKIYPKNWLLILFISFLAISLLATLLYLYISDTAEKEEIHAAQGVADIAMALTHAQLHNLKPHNQNWSDHDFLKSNLSAVVSDPHRLASYFDFQSYFTKNFYSLRIYTSSDLSHFLLIAQPMTSFWHLWIPQSAILIDSNSMEIRKTQDLRSLNRLLADADSLEKDHMEEINVLIKHEELVPLSSLSYELNTKDFLVPSSLALHNPGSENLIYNAPRYHRLGKPLIDTLTKLSKGSGEASDTALLHSEMKALSQLDDLVLYTLEDENFANLAKQTLVAYVPEASSIQIGWLSLDQKGDISCCQVTSNEDLPNIFAEAEDVPKKNNDAEHTDPIHVFILNLLKERRETLAPYAAYLRSLLKAELSQPSLKFETEFEQLSKLFLKLCRQENIKLLQYSLPEEYSQRQSEFLDIAKTEGFGDLLLKSIPRDPTYETLLENIQELINKNLGQSNSLLSIREHVFNELEKMILLPQNAIEALSQDSEKTIKSLLDNDFIKPEERAYFLSEYVLLNSYSRL